MSELPPNSPIIPDDLLALGVTEQGWRLPAILTERVWKYRGEQLLNLVGPYCWAAADWAVFGQEHFPNHPLPAQFQVALQVGKAVPPASRHGFSFQAAFGQLMLYTDQPQPSTDLGSAPNAFVELTRVLKCEQIEGEDTQAYLVRLVNACDCAPQEQWEQLSKDPQEWFDSCLDENNNLKAILPLPDGYVEQTTSKQGFWSRDQLDMLIRRHMGLPNNPKPMEQPMAPPMPEQEQTDDIYPRENFTDRIRCLVAEDPRRTVEEIQKIVFRTHPQGSPHTLRTTVASMKATLRQLLSLGWRPPENVDMARYYVKSPQQAVPEPGAEEVKEVPQLTPTLDLMKLDPDSPPNLSFTKIEEAIMDGKPLTTDKSWWRLLEAAIVFAHNRVGSRTELMGLLAGLNFVEGEKSDKGFVFYSPAGVSVQGQDSNKSFECVCGIARHLGCEMTVKVKWPLKKGIAHAGMLGEFHIMPRGNQHV